MKRTTRKQNALAPSTERPPVPIVAMTLATECADFVHAEGEDRQDLVMAALAVGQWLADQGHPGRWDLVDPEAVARLVSDDAHERGRFLFALTGLMGHAGLCGHVPEKNARDCLTKIVDLAEHPAVRQFARRTVKVLGQHDA